MEWTNWIPMEESEAVQCCVTMSDHSIEFIATRKTDWFVADVDGAPLSWWNVEAFCYGPKVKAEVAHVAVETPFRSLVQLSAALDAGRLLAILDEACGASASYAE